MCINVYTVDEARKEMLNQNRPMKKAGTGSGAGGRSPSSRASNGSSGISSAIENISPDNANSAGGNSSTNASNQATRSASAAAASTKSSEDEPLSLVMNQSTASDVDTHDEQDVDGEEIDDDQPKDLTMTDGGECLDDDDADSGAAGSPSQLDFSGGFGDGQSLIKGGRQRTPPRRKTSGRIKNWCCLKCPNCLADDCGKCINCLDRPKFGGPFIRKQRCLYKKCLMKMKTPQ